MPEKLKKYWFQGAENCYPSWGARLPGVSPVWYQYDMRNLQESKTLLCFRFF
jgi:hypothetical protein